VAVRAAPTAIVLAAFLDIAVDGSDEVCAFDAASIWLRLANQTTGAGLIDLEVEAVQIVHF